MESNDIRKKEIILDKVVRAGFVKDMEEVGRYLW